MMILGEKGLSGVTKIILDLVFWGGFGITLSLPFSLKWYLEAIYQTNTENYAFMLIFLYITGIACLILVNEMRKIFKTLNRKNPFKADNVKSLKRVGHCCFFIAAGYIVKLIFFSSVLTIIITMIFIIAGLFATVLADVFQQAIIVKEENDLTI